MSGLYVVGLGPGDCELLAPAAAAAIMEADCIAGYELYLKLVPPALLTGKRIVVSGMRHESERCEAAISAARNGETAALVCSGDPGVYALAGLVIEALEKNGLLEKVTLEIIPGIPAFCAAAAKLGAPVGHDFACVSLSDLLTPWPVIQKRLEAAIAADFVCALYNPRSRGRPDYLAEALALAARYRAPDCPVGLARNIGRPGEKTVISRLAEFDPQEADMLSLVFIGNSESRKVGGYFLTPRGYAKKYG